MKMCVHSLPGITQTTERHKSKNTFFVSKNVKVIFSQNRTSYFDPSHNSIYAVRIQLQCEHAHFMRAYQPGNPGQSPSVWMLYLRTATTAIRTKIGTIVENSIFRFLVSK